jgi:hypothetical protein
MADHRAEDIVTTIVTQLTGLATTGSRVFRDREYELSEAELPALLVYMVSDNPRQPSILAAPGLLDCELRLIVEAVVKSSAAQVDTTLNQIRYEVSQALHDDVTQGLTYVMHTVEGMAVPELQPDVDQMVGRLRMDWTVLYRRTLASPTPPGPISCAYPLDMQQVESSYPLMAMSNSDTTGTITMEGDLVSTVIYVAAPTGAFVGSAAEFDFTSGKKAVGFLFDVDAAVDASTPAEVAYEIDGSALDFGLSPLAVIRVSAMRDGTFRVTVLRAGFAVVHTTSGLATCPAWGVLVLDGDAGTFRAYLPSGELSLSANTFTPSSAIVILSGSERGVSDAGNAGRTASATSVTQAEDIPGTGYAVGVTDPCGNII